MDDSECSSGCESGWTSYLDNSFASSPRELGNGNGNGNGDGKFGYQSLGNGKTVSDEEEDMSMVSDASSGPPHFPEEDDTVSKPRRKKQKPKENKKPAKKSSLLDDTASSPVFNPPNKTYESEAILDASKGYSTTELQGNSAYQYQQEYFQYPSLSGNYVQQNNQWFVGSTWQP